MKVEKKAGRLQTAVKWDVKGWRGNLWREEMEGENLMERRRRGEDGEINSELAESCERGENTPKNTQQWNRQQARGGREGGDGG